MSLKIPLLPLLSNFHILPRSLLRFLLKPVQQDHAVAFRERSQHPINIAPVSTRTSQRSEPLSFFQNFVGTTGWLRSNSRIRITFARGAGCRSARNSSIGLSPESVRKNTISRGAMEPFWWESAKHEDVAARIDRFVELPGRFPASSRRAQAAERKPPAPPRGARDVPTAPAGHRAGES